MLVVVAQAGSYENFDIGLSTEGAFNFGAHLLSALINLNFSGLKFAAAVTGSVVRWAITLDATTWFGGVMGRLTRSLHTAIGFGTGGTAGFDTSVYRFLLVCTVAIIFWRLTKGDTSRALTNLLVTGLVLTVYLGWYANSGGSGQPASSVGIAQGAISVAQQAGAGLAADLIRADAAALPGNCVAEAQSETAAKISALQRDGLTLTEAERAAGGVYAAVSTGCVIEATVRTMLVMPAYEILNWGERLGDANDNSNPYKACAAVRDGLLADRDAPWGNSDEPRDRMNAAGCGDFAEYQKAATWNKYWTSGAYTLFPVFMLTPALIVGLVAVWVGIRLSLIAMFVPVVAALGLIPGEPRAVLWRWFGSLGQRMVTLASGFVALALWTLVVLSLTEATVNSAAFQVSGPIGGTVAPLIPVLIGSFIGMVIGFSWWRVNRRGKQAMDRLASRLAAMEGISAAPGRQGEMGQQARRLHRRARHAQRVQQGYHHGGAKGAADVMMHRRRGAMAQSARAVTPPTP